MAVIPVEYFYQPNPLPESYSPSLLFLHPSCFSPSLPRHFFVSIEFASTLATTMVTEDTNTAPTEETPNTALEVPKPEPNATTASLHSSLPSGDAEDHAEKGAPQPTTVDLDRVGETEGYILDEATLKAKLGLAHDAVLKKSKKGIVLIPQPSEDPEDPLNWPQWKKAVILLVIAVNACTADYSAATGASALLPQAQDWHITPNEVNHATAG